MSGAVAHQQTSSYQGSIDKLVYNKRMLQKRVAVTHRHDQLLWRVGANRASRMSMSETNWRMTEELKEY
jgi:hypothetical protein